MEEIKIVSRFDSSKVLVVGKYASIKEACEKNSAYLTGADLRGAYLTGAYLTGADLRGAYLMGAYLRGADLRGAKEYYNSHDFFAEIIRRQKVETFTNDEWCAIGQIIIYTLCWDSIHKRFDKEAMSIFKKLDNEGFGEFLKKFKEEE